MRIYEKVSNYIKNNRLSSENIAKQSGIPQKDLQAIINHYLQLKGSIK